MRTELFKQSDHTYPPYFGVNQDVRNGEKKKVDRENNKNDM